MIFHLSPILNTFQRNWNENQGGSFLFFSKAFHSGNILLLPPSYLFLTTVNVFTQMPLRLSRPCLWLSTVTQNILWIPQYYCCLNSLVNWLSFSIHRDLYWQLQSTQILLQPRRQYSTPRHLVPSAKPSTFAQSSAKRHFITLLFEPGAHNS